MKKKLMTATQWEDEGNPTGWYSKKLLFFSKTLLRWMTEKYDGMRLLWNGTAFFTRQGKRLKAPESITMNMPKVVLDGELWTQYGLYQDSVQLSQSTDEQKWKKAIFWVFDAPEIGDKPYEVRFVYHEILEFQDRIDYLKELKKDAPDFVQIIETVQCKGNYIF
jgi:ATP-dependent DNA ligase